MERQKSQAPFASPTKKLANTDPEITHGTADSQGKTVSYFSYAVVHLLFETVLKVFHLHIKATYLGLKQLKTN